MHSAVMTLFGVAAQPGHVLAAPGSLSPLASLARAQVSTSAAAPGADNQTWSEFTANAPRFAGAAQRLLVEGQRGNAIRNPRCEGTGGASGLPTNWSIGTSLTGLTVTNLGVFVVDGVHCVRVRVNGTPSASFMALAFDTTTGIVAAPSQAWASSFFVRTVDLTAPPSQWRYTLIGRTATGVAVAGNSFNTATFVPGAALQRLSRAETLTADATIARITSGIQIHFTASQPLDFTVDIGWPQLEQASFASTPVLPPAAAPAASTRGADLVTAPLPGLGIGGGGACTLLWSGLLAQAAPAGAAQTILTLDDGTAGNRFALVNAAGGASLVAERALAGAVASTTLGTHTPGALVRLGLAVDGAGRLAASLNGGPAMAVTGGPSAGLTTLRLGNAASGAAAMFGETALLRVLPQALSDAALAAAVAALP